MAGKFLAVKKALLSVTSCLQEAGNSGSNKPMGMVPHGYGILLFNIWILSYNYYLILMFVIVCFRW